MSMTFQISLVNKKPKKLCQVLFSWQYQTSLKVIGCHMGVRRMKEHIALTLTWLSLINDVIKYCREYQASHTVSNLFRSLSWNYKLPSYQATGYATQHDSVPVPSQDKLNILKQFVPDVVMDMSSHKGHSTLVVSVGAEPAQHVY